MCGIIGFVGDKNAVPIILDGLKRLEYRGYDSAGIAVFGENGFEIVKQKGRLGALELLLGDNPCEGTMGIGHTRWATHGEPSDVNSHPHLGSESKIAIVHNGIIENFKQLKGRLERKGVTFASQTDSEVVAQLAERFYNGNLLETVVKTANALEGSYALGIMCLDEPDILVAVKKDNPLIVGVSEEGNFIASDVPAILEHTNQVYYLDDKEIAVLSGSEVLFYNMDMEPLEKQIETISWSIDSAEKGGYPHFMLKEIMEQPRVMRDTLQSAMLGGENKKVIDNIKIEDFDKIVVTACGSAYNAGVVSKYVFERLCRFRSIEVELASEFRYKDAVIDEKTLVILISQSGETADTIAALREAKAKGAVTLAIVNVVGSAIAKEADFTMFTAAGPEIAVATTKAFSTQLLSLYILAIRFAAGLKRISHEEEKHLMSELCLLPDKITEIFNHVDYIQKYASTCIGCKNVFFIGRNIDYAIALEGALKLKEISYVHSEAYAGGELKHGPISLVEEDTLVVTISCCERLFSKIFSNAEQVISRGAKVLFVGNACDVETSDRVTLVKLPEIHELFSPSLSVIVLQLFSYYVAANKGLDIDKPRNLAKSVTVE